MTTRVPSDLLRDEIARLAADPARIHQATEDVADAIHAELIVGVDIRSETRAAAEGVVRLLIEMIGRGQLLRMPNRPIASMREFRRVPSTATSRPTSTTTSGSATARWSGSRSPRS